MQKINIYSLTFLIAFLCLLFFYNVDKPKELTSQNQIIIKRENNIQSTPKPKKNTQIESSFDKSNTIIETTVFSDDPLIDKFIMMHKYRFCIKKFKIDAAKKNKIKQEMMFHENNLYCDKINKQHPEYQLKDKHWNDYVNNPPSNSYLGRLFSDNEFYKSHDYDIKRIIKEAKNISPDLFLSDQFVFMYEYMTNTNKILMDTLQSHQADYVSTIASYAQNLYACRIGADCGKNSTLMLTHCISNKNFCMDDYELLIKTKLTQGQQTDVALAYKFYETFFNIE